MAILAPFRGIFYNQEEIQDLSQVVTPPYDVITKGEQEEFYRRHPYNVIRLVLGKDLPGDSDEKNKYTRAADYLRKWYGKGILKEDLQPSIYYYQQEFFVKEKQRMRRNGFFALIKLEDFNSGVVLPHEKTMKGPKADRLRLMEACTANLSPIFSLYSDPERKIDGVLEEQRITPPFINFVDENGSAHQLWKINDMDIIREVAKEVEGNSLYIADGHHRYETALNYSIQMRKTDSDFDGSEEYNYVMMYLSNMNDDGLVILPTHRIIRNLEGFDTSIFKNKIGEYFHVKEFEFNSTNELQVRKELFLQLQRMGQQKPTFGLFLGGARCYNLLTLKSEDLLNSGMMDDIPSVLRGLDVSILQTFILKHILGINDRNMEYQKNVDFTEDGDEAIEIVKNDRYQLVFLMNPTKVKQVKEAGCAGVRMPQKSTFFYPKLLCGLVFNKIQGRVSSL